MAFITKREMAEDVQEALFPDNASMDGPVAQKNIRRMVRMKMEALVNLHEKAAAVLKLRYAEKGKATA